MADLAILLKEGKYSDLTLMCQDEEFKIHRNIVCAQSPVFAAAVDGGFKESITNRINVTGFEPDTVKLMLDFLYTGDYSIPGPPEVDEEASIPADPPEAVVEDTATKTSAADPPGFPECELIPNIKINAIANYYQIQKLADLATDKADDLLNDDAVDISPSLLSDVIKQTFGLSGDSRLQEVVATAAADQIDVMVACEELTDLDGIGDAGLAIIEKLAARIADLESNNVENEGRELALKASLKAKDAKLKTISKIKSCRSCGTSFNAFLEKNSNGTDGDLHFVRCKGCKSKNFGSGM